MVAFVAESIVRNGHRAPLVGALLAAAVSLVGAQIVSAQAVPTSDMRSAAARPRSQAGGSQILYTVTPLKLVSTGKYSAATAINSQGQVAGWASMNAADSSRHAFLYSGGAFTDLGTFGGTYSAAAGLNDNGEVVGQSTYASLQIEGNLIVYNLTHAFDYRGGQLIDLTPTSQYYSTADSINNSGQIAGGLTDDATDTYHGFLYQNGVFTNIDAGDSAHASEALKINASGQICGRMNTLADIYDGSYGFYWSGGSYHTFLPEPRGNPSSISAFNGMNDAGQCVGAAAETTGYSTLYPFVYDGAALTYLGSGIGAATAINAHGHVVGYYYSPDSTLQTGFLYNGSSYTMMSALGTAGNGTSWLEANAVNNFDQVGGKGFNVSGNYAAFVARNGVVTDLNTLVDPSLGLNLYNVDHINDSGLMTVSDYNSIEYLLTPVLSVVSSHSGSFAPGQQSAAYTVTVTNASTAPATNGAVTMTETLPAGLTLASLAGNNWTCTLNSSSCTRSDSLNPGASYDPITVTVNVAGNASSPQVNWVSVSEGGVWLANSSDSTVIQALGQSTTAAASTTTPFTTTSRNVTLTATVTSGSGPVNSGTVTFNVTGIGTVLSGTVTNGNASASLPIGGGTPAASYTITATYSGSTGIAGSSDSTHTLTIGQATPVITWSNPANMLQGSALGSGQLNATANVPGTFVYTPAAGAVLPVGQNTLSVAFTPNDSTDYANVSDSVTVTVTASNTVCGQGATIVLTRVLSRDTSNNIVVVVTATNTGCSASQVTLTTAQLGAKTPLTSLPLQFGALAIGTSGQVTVTFPASAGASGTTVLLTLDGTWTAPNGGGQTSGSFGGTSRTTLP
jgi:uncharacterized repeat protein (TIGR01451 family)